MASEIEWFAIELISNWDMLITKLVILSEWGEFGQKQLTVLQNWRFSFAKWLIRPVMSDKWEEPYGKCHYDSVFFSQTSANDLWHARSILVIPGNCLACCSYIPLACEATHRHQLKYEDHVMSRAKHTKCAYHWSELARLANQSANGTHWFCGTEPEICFHDQTCMASS